MCEPDYVKDANNNCNLCGVFTSGSMTMAIVGAAVITLAVVGCVLHSKGKMGLWARVMELAWPRFKQAGAILITNFQIISNVGTVSAITFPQMFVNAVDAIATIVNMEILNLPGLACLFSSTYYRKFISKMLFPILLVGVIKLASVLHIRRIRTTTMRMPEGLPPSRCIMRTARRQAGRHASRHCKTHVLASVPFLISAPQRRCFDVNPH